MDKERTRLSKGILQMKFMKRSSMVKELEDDTKDQQQQIDDDHWVLDLPELKQKKSKYIVDQSLVHIQELKFGRMSYKGFNPEIEKLMAQQDQDQELLLAEEREREMGVDDVEMAERFTNLVGTIQKKFSKKREAASDSGEEDKPIKKIKKEKKMKKTFLKPDDDS